MLVKFFRSDNVIVPLIVAVLITVYAIITASFTQYILPATRGTLTEFLFNINDSIYLGIGLTMFLLFGVGLLLNLVSNRFELSGRRSFLVFITYLIIFSLGSENLLFSLESVANLLIAVLMFRFFQIANTTKPQAVIFDSSLLVAVLGILNPINILLIIWVWVGIIMFRSFYLRDWVVSFIGGLLPILYLLVARYIFDLELIISDQFTVSLPKYSPTTIGLMLSVGLLVVPGVLFFLGQLNQNVAVTRKMMSQVILLFGLLLIIVLLSGTNQPIILLAVPLSIMVANFLMGVKKAVIADVLLVLFIAISTYFHFS